MTESVRITCGAMGVVTKRPCQAPRHREGGVVATHCKLHGGRDEVRDEIARRQEAARTPRHAVPDVVAGSGAFEAPRHRRGRPPAAEGATLVEALALPATLEELVTGERYGALDASPVQRAICRLATGRDAGPICDADLERYFGSLKWRNPLAAVAGVCLVCGIRGGKTRLAAAAAVWGALTAVLDGVEDYEDIAAVVVGPTVRQAKKTFRQVLGLLRRPGLAGLIVGDPTSDTVKIRRPDGREVSILVVAPGAGGEGLRGSWLAALVIEEAAYWRSEVTGAVVNAEETLDAAEGRLLPGAQQWVISSPRGPSGLLHTIWKHNFGPPGDVGPDGLIPWLVVHAPTRALNPTFSEAKIEAARAKNADKAAREHDAIFVEDDAALFSAVDLDACVRMAPADAPRVPGLRYVAAIDPAVRLNAFTLVIGAAAMRAVSVPAPFVPGTEPGPPTIEMRRTVAIACVRQWIPKPGQPVDLETTLASVAEVCRPYGVTSVRTDGWSADSLRTLSRRYGIELVACGWTSDQWLEAYEELRTLAATRTVDLPPDPYVRFDLLAARRRTRGNKVSVHLPTTPDGRHCDYAPGLALVAGSGGVGSGAEAHTEEAPREREAREWREREERSIRRLEQAAREAREDEDDEDGGYDDDDET